MTRNKNKIKWGRSSWLTHIQQSKDAEYTIRPTAIYSVGDRSYAIGYVACTRTRKQGYSGHSIGEKGAAWSIHTRTQAQARAACQRHLDGEIGQLGRYSLDFRGQVLGPHAPKQ